MRIPEIVCLDDVVKKAVPWMWQPYLAFEMLSMLSGDPGSGKTFIALAIAAALSRGEVPVSGERCTPMSTLYLSNENAADYVTKPRFDALGGDAKRFHILKGSIDDTGKDETRSSITLQDVELLDEAIQRTKAKLVVIDPIQSYMGDVDAHKACDTRPVMDRLIRLAEKSGVCALVLRHLTKSSGGRALHRGLGSIDFTAAVRTELFAGSEAGNPNSRALVPIKNNLGSLGDSLGYEITGEGMESKLEWRGKSDLTANDLLAPDAEGQSDISAACDFLLVQLASGPKLQTELLQAGTFPEHTLQRAARRLGLRKSRDGERGRWIWSLREPYPTTIPIPDMI